MTKKEAFVWLKKGTKTIDVRKGKARRVETALFLSGPNKLKLSIINKETGKLAEVIRAENYKSVIPPAKTLEDALSYLRCLCETEEDIFTAYYLKQKQ